MVLRFNANIIANDLENPHYISYIKTSLLWLKTSKHKETQPASVPHHYHLLNCCECYANCILFSVLQSVILYSC